MSTTEAIVEAGESQVAAATAELRERFLQAGGCQARDADFARVCPEHPAPAVMEALHRLAEAGEIELYLLPDGEPVFCFPAS